MRRWLTTIRIVAIILLLVLAAAAVGGWWYIQENPAWQSWLQDNLDQALLELGLTPQEPVGGLLASGFVEAREVSVSSEMGGRIVALHADEGDEVVAGQVLVELDGALLDSQIHSAEAEVAMAEAMLAQVRAGVSQETLDHARAELQQAQAAEEAARVAWEDAVAMRDNPQDLELALTAAEAQLEVLDRQVAQAQAQAQAADTGRELAAASVRLLEDIEPHTKWVLIGTWVLPELPPEIPLPPGVGDGEYYIGDYRIVVAGGTVRVYLEIKIQVPAALMAEARQEWAATTQQAWQAWAGLSTAQAARSGATDYAGELAQQVANPVTLEVQADAAQAQHEVASASVGLAQAQVEGLQLGATPEQISAAEAQVEIARAALESLQVQVDKLRLTAPISGLVLERTVRVGEVAMAGSPILTLADLDQMTLTVYVPEDQLGQVRLGQPVSVTVDAYPGRTFSGAVSYLSDEAEFTPRNVQAREERVNMVFAVRIRLPNADHALKPGMPADAVLQDRDHE
jgi:HlyD family secretion protein